MIGSKRRNASRKGFTLVEMIIAVSVFAIFVAVIAGFLVSVVKSQRDAFIKRQMVSEVGFTMEYMSRAIRMAKTATSAGECGIAPGTTYQVNTNEIVFRNVVDECQVFRLVSGRVYEQIDLSPQAALTSDNLNIARFDIQHFPLATHQPRVRFVFQAEWANNQNIMLEMQTTLSQRNLNVP